ncbi:MAG: SUMF1/EgtB/PvdO family nonheme iron enzyme [Sedimentisphaerales bacterium]|nr:SUMF1/EgtB/PvdO family nonheme iron enzyme [Sedimentisphaerales bacterium]
MKVTYLCFLLPLVLFFQVSVSIADSVDIKEFPTDSSYNLSDFARLAGSWLGGECQYPDWCFSSDYNMSGAVDMLDLEYLMTVWLKENQQVVKPSEFSWVFVDDPNFVGYVSKYETTNAQFCHFLNEALATGDIIVNNGLVYGAVGANEGLDYVDRYYYITSSVSEIAQIAYTEGKGFRVNMRSGLSMANHPVTMVSGYGATAFCNYYGYYLPTDVQWQTVADFDGSYVYGCGNELDVTTSNCDTANPLGFNSSPFTTPVGYYGEFGYGLCDLAGNVSEWTSSQFGIYRVIKGGGWLDTYKCEVDFISGTTPSHVMEYLGFRPCRN